MVAITNLSEMGGPDIEIEDDGVVTSLGPEDPPFEAVVDLLPEAPTDLIGRAKRSKANLLWTAVEDADSYDVYRSGESGGPYDFIGSVSRNVFVDTGLTTGETYFYVVQTVGEHGNSMNSDEVEVLVPARRRRR